MHRDISDSDFGKIHALYNSLELEIYRAKDSLDTIFMLARRLSIYKSEAIQRDIEAINGLCGLVETIVEADERIGQTKAELLNESNERYSSKK